jgi:phage-related protein
MIVPDDSYDDIAYPVTLRIAGEPERFDNSALYALLHGARQLKISQLPRYFFRVKRISGITPTARLRGNEFTYNLTFTLSPFKYIDAEPTVELTGGGVVLNNGTRYCKPVYTLTMSANSGQGTLTVNGRQVTITIPETDELADGRFIVDADLEMAYGTDGSNRTMQTAGIFRFLAVGQNAVTLGGICQSVNIKRNGRCY